MRRHAPDAVIVELGGNDMLMGWSPERAEANLGPMLATATEGGRPALLVGIHAPGRDRDLRRRAYEAWTARGANGGDTDNRAIVAETLKLREERARLLGFESFADWKLETEMARTPGAVRDLLMAVWAPARDAAEPR